MFPITDSDIHQYKTLYLNRSLKHFKPMHDITADLSKMTVTSWSRYSEEDQETQAETT
jgi:hypothetical protein